MGKEIEFLTKSVVKNTMPYVSVTINGSSRHKGARFTFRNGFGQMISKTGYIVVSNISEESDRIYFSESDEEEGYLFKVNDATSNGAIIINAHWLAEKIEEYGWVGDYSEFYKENGYYCIHKEDRTNIVKKKR